MSLSMHGFRFLILVVKFPSTRKGRQAKLCFELLFLSTVGIFIGDFLLLKTVIDQTFSEARIASKYVKNTIENSVQ